MKKQSERRLPSQKQIKAVEGRKSKVEGGDAFAPLVAAAGESKVEGRRSKAKAEVQKTRQRRQRPKSIAAKRRQRNRPKGEAEKRGLLRVAAFELRARKRTYRSIAEELKCNVATAFALVNEYWKELEETTRERAEMLRAMELEDLDRLEQRWLPLALDPCLEVSEVRDSGNGEPVHIEMAAYDAGLKAVDRVVKIKEARAKLLGLYAPAKVEHSGEVRGLTLEEFRARMKEGMA